MSVTFDPSNLKRKSITRDMSGNIVHWIDEADGGWIIRNRMVVNQEKYDAWVKKENDKLIASRAAAEQTVAPKRVEESRTQMPSAVTLEEPKKETKAEKARATSIKKLEAKVNGMEDKLDAILKALNK